MSATSHLLPDMLQRMDGWPDPEEVRRKQALPAVAAPSAATTAEAAITAVRGAIHQIVANTYDGLHILMMMFSLQSHFT